MSESASPISSSRRRSEPVGRLRAACLVLACKQVEGYARLVVVTPHCWSASAGASAEAMRQTSPPRERIGSRLGDLGEDISIGVVKRLRLAPNHKHSVLVVGPSAVGVDRDLDPVLDGLEGIFEEWIRANSVHL